MEKFSILYRCPSFTSATSPICFHFGFCVVGYREYVEKPGFGEIEDANYRNLYGHSPLLDVLFAYMNVSATTSLK